MPEDIVTVGVEDALIVQDINNQKTVQEYMNKLFLGKTNELVSFT